MSIGNTGFAYLSLPAYINLKYIRGNILQAIMIRDRTLSAAGHK